MNYLKALYYFGISLTVWVVLISCKSMRENRILTPKKSTIYSISSDPYNDLLFVGKEYNELDQLSVLIYKKGKLLKEVSLQNKGYIVSLKRDGRKLYGLQNRMSDILFFSIDLSDNFGLNHIDSCSFGAENTDIGFLQSSDEISPNIYYVKNDTLNRVSMRERDSSRITKMPFIQKDNSHGFCGLDSSSCLFASFDPSSYNVQIGKLNSDSGAEKLASFHTDISCQRPKIILNFISQNLFISIIDLDGEKTEIWKYNLDIGTVVYSSFDNIIFNFHQTNNGTYVQIVDSLFVMRPYDKLSTSIRVKKFNFDWKVD